MKAAPIATVILACSACGRLEFVPLDDDGGGADGPGLDGGPFGAPELVAALSDPAADDDPTLTGDMLEVYFASSRAGGLGADDIWSAVRTSVDDPWQPPQPVTAINSTSNDESPGVTADGLQLYFASRRAGGFDIWISIRNARTDPWPPPVEMVELSSAIDDYQPQPSRSHLRLVLYRSTTSSRDLYEAARSATTMAWSPPVALSSINSIAGDRSPCLDDSELEIMFSSDRNSAMADVQDLFRATRATVVDPFLLRGPLDELNTAFDEDDPWLSPDGRVLFFTSNRSGNNEIYEARR